MQRKGWVICWDEHSNFPELERDLGNHQWRSVLTPLQLLPPRINILVKGDTSPEENCNPVFQSNLFKHKYSCCLIQHLKKKMPLGLLDHALGEE